MIGRQEKRAMDARIGISERELSALATLNDRGVEYVLIGGCAMRFWGHRRHTEDVDLLANNDHQNSLRLYEAICAILGFAPRFTADLLATDYKQVRLRDRGPDLAILTSIDGLGFAEVLAARVLANEHGTALPVASPKHLLFIKRAEARKLSKRLKKVTGDIKFLESL